MLANIFFVLLAGLAISLVLAIPCYLLCNYANLDFFELPTLIFAHLAVIFFVSAIVVGVLALVQFFIVGIVGGIVTLF